jgi:SAM-dependent methyltransferase
MATHKRGRRNIRRLTRRKIALPTSASTSLRPEAEATLDFGSSESAVSERNSALSQDQSAPEADGGGVASSLSELRLPGDESATAEINGVAAAGDEPAAESGEKREQPDSDAERDAAADSSEAVVDAVDEKVAKPSAETDESAASAEHSEDEPATNPHIRLTESLREGAARESTSFDTSSFDPSSFGTSKSGGDRSESAKRGSNQPPPAAGASSLPPPAPSAGKSPSESANARAAEPSSSSDVATDVASAEGDPESEPATGQHPKQSGRPLAGSASVRRKPDSDAPTRPRIELSHEMALAAGRVSSHELSPIRSEQPPRRGSKVPPPGEPRVVSSLTGRRSAIPVSSDEEAAAVRPSVIVTRSKIISDRPPKMPDAESLPARVSSAKRDRADIPKRVATEPLKGATTATEKSEAVDIAKPDHGELAPDSADVPEITAEDSESTAPDLVPASVGAETAQRKTVEIERPAVVESAVPPSMRPSRRPGAAEGEEFETLDIEDGEVESQSVRGETEIDADFDDDGPSRAPPPPPQHKRAGVPPAPVAPGPPKAAPPPPPRATGTTGQLPVAAAASGSVATSMPAPTLPGSGASAAAVATGAPMISPASFAGAAAGGPAKRGSRPQPRRRQWWETLFSDDYLRTVVRPTSAQISRQVDFMQASLGVTKGTALLDVGCGLGQHALEFARRGCLVVALDLALPMITRAAEDAQQEGLRINFLHKDIRDIGFEGTFDAVVCVGTTFGFFDDEQNREVLGRLANALKPGGRLLLEVVNRDHVLDSQPNLQWFEGDGCVVMEESDFNYYSSRITVKRTMMREDGRQTESEYSIRLYALHELGQMMQAAGFRVKEVSGGQATRGVFFGAQSNRIILLAERRTATPTRGNGHSTSDAPVPTES